MVQKLYIAPAATDPEVTITTPRFDMEAAQLARPVVPFASSANGTRSFNPLRAASKFRNNRLWPLSLVVIAALVGGVAGGLGLSLYQRRPAGAAPTITPPQPVSTVTSAPQPSPTSTDTDQSLTSSMQVEVAEKPVNTTRKLEAPDTMTIDLRSIRNGAKSDAAGKTPPTISTTPRSATVMPSTTTDPSTIQRPRRSQPQVEREKQEPLRAETEPGIRLPEIRSKPRAAETSRADDGPELRRTRTDRVGDVIESQQRRSDVIESRPQRREQPRRTGTITDIFEGPPPQ
ncbi:MAG: hypothetical protein H0T92_20845 [Pyrinomonadaceae bacterium]|nr:hypothetical protein [Pyrinomonadaceae bacterium]